LRRVEEQSLFAEVLLDTKEGCLIKKNQIMTKSGYINHESDGNNDSSAPCEPTPEDEPVL